MSTGIVYLLCVATCLLCAGMLFRGYYRTGVRLLLWSALCFVGLMIDNVMLYIDVGQAIWQKVPGLIAIAILLYGLIWNSK